MPITFPRGATGPTSTDPDQQGEAPGRPSAWASFLTAHAVLVRAVEVRLRAARLPELAWYDVLWTLERAPDHRLRMHELAALTVISRSNMTRLVDRLEAAGLVARDRGCADRRGAYAVLTPTGRTMRQRMWPVYAQAIGDVFDSHLSPAETALMRRIFVRVVKAARG